MANVRDTAEAVKGIVEAVPIYEDLLQPAVKEVGKSLETVAKTVHIALLPVAVLVWSYEQIGAWLLPVLTRKLRDIPEDELITPAIEVAGPAIEALRFTSESSDELRDMYANLLATAMDRRKAETAHPGFVEIIKQLTPDEARLVAALHPPGEPLLRLRAMLVGRPNEWSYEAGVTLLGERANCQYQDLVWSYITNLERLGIVRTEDVFFSDNAMYEPLEQSAQVRSFESSIEAHNSRLDGTELPEDAPPTLRTFLTKLHKGSERRRLIITPFGMQFLDACVRVQTAGPAPEDAAQPTSG